MIQSVDRAMRILDFLKEEPKGLGVTEISNRLNVAKSTVHRLLATLEEHHYVRQMEETSVYRLGLKFIEMSHSVVDNLNVVELAHPILEKVSRETDKITHLVMLDENEVIYIDKVERPSTIRIYSQLGKRAPLYCTGVGKAIASQFTDLKLDAYLTNRSFHPFTDTTITDPTQLKQELLTIKKQGFSIDNGEHEKGIRCLALPVYDHQNEASYGLSITGTTEQMTDEQISAYFPVVRSAADELSRLLGYAQ